MTMNMNETAITSKQYWYQGVHSNHSANIYRKALGECAPVRMNLLQGDTVL